MRTKDEIIEALLGMLEGISFTGAMNEAELDLWAELEFEYYMQKDLDK